MASRIITKKGSGAPLASDLVHGELAVDTVNKRLYTENAGGTVIEVGTSPSTIDINAGTIDGTVIGGTTAAAGSFTTGQFNTSLNVDGTVTADELTVDGTASVSASNAKIRLFETDTTDLNTQLQNQAGDFSISRLDDDAGSLTTHFSIDHSTGNVSIPNGDLDVTGTVTADELTVDGTSTIATFLRDSGANGSLALTFPAQTTTLTSLSGFKINANSADRFNIASNGSVSLYEDTGTTPKFFWDASAESLGIGTSSPAYALHVSGGATNIAAVFESTDADTWISLIDSNTTNNSTVMLGVDTDDMVFRAGGAEYMRLDSTGNVGIGTVSPEKALHVNSGTSNIGLRVESSDATASIEFMDSGTTSTGTSARVGGISDDFFVQTNGSERMRIDSSGNLLVGKSSTGVSGVGVEARNDGFLVATRSSNTVAGFNRTTDDGEIVRFYKDTSTVGSIRSQSGLVTDIILDPRLNNYATGHGFGGTQVSGVPKIIPRDGSGNALDGGIDLGHSNSRFKDLYLSGGVYLGGTGAANLLDDYEEGTWTGTIADASSGGNESPTVVNGQFTKIGQIVYVQFNVSNIDTTGLTAGNNVYITGLPFTTASVTGNAKYTGTANVSVVTFSDTVFLNANESATVLTLLENRSGAGVDSVVVSELSSGASDIHGNLVYQTT